MLQTAPSCSASDQSMYVCPFQRIRASYGNHTIVNYTSGHLQRTQELVMRTCIRGDGANGIVMQGVAPVHVRVPLPKDPRELREPYHSKLHVRSSPTHPSSCHEDVYSWGCCKPPLHAARPTSPCTCAPSKGSARATGTIP